MLYFIETQLIKLQRHVFGFLFRLWQKWGQVIFSFSLILLECCIIFLLFVFYDQASGFLFKQLPRDLIHQLIIAISALLSSAIVLVFGLGQFALQQTLEKTTVYTAEKVRKHPYFRWTYAVLFLIALLSFSLIIVPVRQNTIISIFLGLFLLLVISFSLWWSIFSFSSKLANPSNQLVVLYYLPLKKYLGKLPKLIAEFIRIGGVKDENGKTIAKGDETTISVVFEKAPEFSQNLEHDLDQIFEITKNFARQKRLDVVMTGLKCIVNLTNRYLQIRKNSLMDFTGGGFFIVETPRTKGSRFLESIYERFGVLSSIAIENNDKETLKEIIAQQFLIVYATTQVKPIPMGQNENQIAEFAIHYFYDEGIGKALKNEFYDIGLSGGKHLSRIGSALVDQKNYVTVLSVQKKLNMLGIIGIEKRQWYLVQEALSGISDVLAYAIINEPFIAKQILDESVRYLQELVANYLSYLQGSGLKGRGELSMALSPVFGGDKETSMVNLFYALANKLNTLDKSLTDKYESLFYQFSEKISEDFFVKLIPFLSSDTFLLWHIGSNLRSITLIYSNLLSGNNLLDKERLENDAAWLLSFFRTLYKKTEIPKSRTREFQEILAINAIEAIDANRSKLLKAAISSIKSLSEETLVKDADAYFSAPRTAVYLGYVALYAKKKGDQQIIKDAIKFLVDFQAKYIKKFPSHPGVEDRSVVNELLNFKRNYHKSYRNLPGFNDTESKLATTLSYNEIESYISELVDTIQLQEQQEL